MPWRTRPASASRKPGRLAFYFVIPAKAGIQAAPRWNVEVLQEREVFDPKTPAYELAADLGAAWIPAFAGMTDRSALRAGLWLAFTSPAPPPLLSSIRQFTSTASRYVPASPVVPLIQRTRRYTAMAAVPLLRTVTVSVCEPVSVLAASRAPEASTAMRS